jgi:hypothetical protein
MKEDEFSSAHRKDRSVSYPSAEPRDAECAEQVAGVSADRIQGLFGWGRRARSAVQRQDSASRASRR